MNLRPWIVRGLCLIAIFGWMPDAWATPPQVEFVLDVESDGLAPWRFSAEDFEREAVWGDYEVEVEGMAGPVKGWAVEGDMRHPGGDWKANWRVVFIPWGEQDGSRAVGGGPGILTLDFSGENLTGTNMTFMDSVSVTMDIFDPDVQGSYGLTATDGNGDGVMVCALTGDSVYDALLDGVSEQTLSDDPFCCLTTTPFGSNFCGDAFARRDAGVAMVSMAELKARVDVTPGDSFAFSGVLAVIPGPTICAGDVTAIVPMLGVGSTPSMMDSVTVPIIISGLLDPIDAFGFDLAFPSDTGTVDTDTTMIYLSTEASGFTAPWLLDTMSPLGTLLPIPPDSNEVRIGAFTDPDTMPSSPDTLAYVSFRVDDPLNPGPHLLPINDLVDDLVDFGSCGVGMVTIQQEGTGDVDNSGLLDPGDATCAFNCFQDFGVFDPGCDPSGLGAYRADVECLGIGCSVAGARAIQNRWCNGLIVPTHCFERTPQVQCVPPEPGRSVADATQLEGRIEPVDVPRGGTARAKLEMRGNGALTTIAFDLLLPAGVEVVGVERASGTQEWPNLGVGLSQEGIARLAAFDLGGTILNESAWTPMVTLVLRGTAAAAPGDARFYLGDTFDGTEALELRDSVVNVVPGSLPTSFAMSRPRPNPTAGSTAIPFAIPVGHEGAVSLSVFSVDGRLVKSLVKGDQEPGNHEAIWDGRDARGNVVSAGIYFARLETQEFAETQKIVRTR